MDFSLLIRLTFVLGAGVLLLLMTRRLDPAHRHALCLLVVLRVLLLQVPSLRPEVALPFALPVVFSATASSQPTAFAIGYWLRMVWLAGAAAVGGRFLCGYFYMSWRTRRIAPGSILQEAEGVRLKYAPVTTPVVWGLVNPTILLPEPARTWSEERRQLAILHEMAHIRRHDLWSSLLINIGKAVYWFHPLVWWLAAKAAEEQERACDDRVLATGASAPAYASLLVDIARQGSSAKSFSPALFGCAMVTTSNTLRGRIMYILQDREKRSRWSIAALAASAGLLAVLWTVSPVRADNHTAANQEQIYRVGGDVTAPHVVTKVNPTYPRSAKIAKVEGVVKLAVVIDSSGVPTDIQVQESVESSLDQSAIDAVKQWRFDPATKNGEPVTVQATINITYHLTK